MDPNEIVRPGTPETAWITPDGKYITTDPDEAKANGATHQVSAANVVFADGRKQWIVFNGAARSLAPGTYSPAGPQMGYDKEQQARWQQQQSATTRGDQEGDTRGPQTGQTREVYRGGKWVVEPNPLYQGPSGSTAKEWRTEGTPLPGGGFDNSKPIMAAYVNGQRTGETRQPTAAELKDWNEAGQRSRNPGGKTDDEIKAGNDADDKTVTDVSYTGTGKNRKKVTTYKSGRKTTEDAPTNATATKTEYRPDGTKVVTYDDGTTTTEAPSPAETRAAGKDDFPGEPADAPPPNMTPGQVAEGLRKYSAYLSQQVKLWKDSGGKQGIAPEQATKLMDNRIKIAEAAGRESTNLANQQTSIYNGQVTQRGQSLVETASRRGDANSAYNNNLARFIPNITMMGAGGGKLVADALGASLGANTEYVRNWGGLRETPEVGLPGFLQTIRDSSMAGIQTAANGGPVLTGPVGAPPAQPPAPGMTPAFVPRPPADPAMAAAEAARQAAAATGGATMPGTPTMAPPAPAPAGAAGPNPYGPQPGDPMTQAPSINPATGEPTGLAPLPVNGQFPSTPPPAPAVNPVNAQPITPPAITPPPEAAPFQDEQRSPGYGFPLQTTVESPAQAGDLPLPQPGMLPQSMTPSFLTPMRYGAQYDPRQRAAALGIRPDILELALAG